MALLLMILQSISQYLISAKILSLTRKRKSYSKYVLHTKLNYHSTLDYRIWNYVLNESGTNKAYSVYVYLYSSIYNQAFPKIRVKVKYFHRKHWLTKVMKNSIRQKNIIQIIRKYPVIDSILKYKTYHSTLKELLKQGKKLYYQDLFNAYRNDMRKTWSVIKRIFNKIKGGISRSMIFHNDETITYDHMIANSFSNFF